MEMLMTTKGLTKRYGEHLALNNVDLEIAAGQLIAYIGTNGAGKSTTINMLTGLVHPTAGIISRAVNLKIGVVFQNSVLDQELTVWDNLYLRGRMYHDFSRAWLDQLITLMGIKKLLPQKYGSLSGGQRRRVDIARALINQPDLLFLDEPTTGLDLQTRLAIWTLLRKLQRQGLTIFLTTHYLEEAENADLVYILANGRILAQGTATMLKAQFSQPKLLVRVKNINQVTTQHKYTARGLHRIELATLPTTEVIKFLQDNQANITDFEYQNGSLNEAFIAITGKELC
ncbi:ABC transporter ATPase [Ligilactobacillus saerimneri 30a]|uniref:ABC transporter ATPase n=2 Tax=Ligilactobacillus saerimneri TaxID=228229 RepID=M5J7R5_9LACO|nr:ABC transporter ATPase [Ligilactobacillus saerimneri 30a]